MTTNIRELSQTALSSSPIPAPSWLPFGAQRTQRKNKISAIPAPLALCGNPNVPLPASPA